MLMLSIEPNERGEARALGQRKAKQKRVHYPHNAGRPTKTSGTYYNHHVLITEEDFLYVYKNKLHPSEPLGAVISRLIARKKVEGSELDDPNAWIRYGWQPNKELVSNGKEEVLQTSIL